MATYPNFEARPESTPGNAPQPGIGQLSQGPSGEFAVMPAVDFVDNTDEVWVLVDLPGFTEEEISVSGDQNTLVVSAERPSDVEEGRSLVHRERPSRFERRIPLPTTVEITGAKASYEAGVCKVVLPKSAAEEYQEIAFTPG